MATAQQTAPRCNWPAKLYVAALLFAFISMGFFTPALDGRAMNGARVAAQLAICGVLGLRLAWALLRREQSKTWIPYTVSMFFAAPIWLVVEPLVLSLGGDHPVGCSWPVMLANVTFWPVGGMLL